MKQETSNESNSAERLKLATQIMAGLLASGHYTERSPDPGDEQDPRVIRFDHGEDWKKEGLRGRFIYFAVEEAISLLEDLEDGVNAKFPTAPPIVPPGFRRLETGQWQRRHGITGNWIASEPPDSEPVETLVSQIDFPHLREGGQWMQTDATPPGENRSGFKRACFYASQLRALGMSDPDVQCLLGDLYWDAAAEMESNQKSNPALRS